MELRVLDGIRFRGVDVSERQSSEAASEIGGISKVPGFEMLLGIRDLDRCPDVVTQSSWQLLPEWTDNVIGSFSVSVYQNDKFVRRRSCVRIPRRLYKPLGHSYV